MPLLDPRFSIKTLDPNLLNTTEGTATKVVADPLYKEATTSFATAPTWSDMLGSKTAVYTEAKVLADLAEVAPPTPPEPITAEMQKVSVVAAADAYKSDPLPGVYYADAPTAIRAEAAVTDAAKEYVAVMEPTPAPTPEPLLAPKFVSATETYKTGITAPTTALPSPGAGLEPAAVPTASFSEAAKAYLEKMAAEYEPPVTTAAPETAVFEASAGISPAREEEILVEVATSLAPSEEADAVIGDSQKQWEVTRLPYQSQTNDELESTLVDESNAQKTVVMPSSTPVVTTSPEILADSFTRLRTYAAASAYGTPTAPEAAAQMVEAETANPPTVKEAQIQQMDMTHEALVQTAAQATEYRLATNMPKPLIPPAQSAATQQAEQTQVTVGSAIRSSDFEFRQGKIGAAYLQNALESGNAPVMPNANAALPVAPDLPGFPTYVPESYPVDAEPKTDWKALAKKYGPYAAAGAIAILLLRR